GVDGRAEDAIREPEEARPLGFEDVDRLHGFRGHGLVHLPQRAAPTGSTHERAALAAAAPLAIEASLSSPTGPTQSPATKSRLVPGPASPGRPVRPPVAAVGTAHATWMWARKRCSTIVPESMPASVARASRVRRSVAASRAP